MCKFVVQEKTTKNHVSMPRVLFRVTYLIPDGKRSEYLSLVGKLRKHYASNGIDYAVYEDKGKHNHFQEVYVYPSMEAYEASDDPSTLTDVSETIDAVYAMASKVEYDVAKEVT